MTNLKEVNFGINRYCGPAVLSALTGESTDRCAAVISVVSGKKEIKGTNREHLKEALKRLRFDVEEIDFGGTTLYGKLYNMHNFDGLYVVFVPYHVVALEVKNNDIYICDNHSKTPLLINQSARLRQKVEGVWRVTRKKTPKFLRSEIQLEIKEDINFLINIYSLNIYEDPEDNNRYRLGNLSYKDKIELDWIINKLIEWQRS